MMPASVRGGGGGGGGGGLIAHTHMGCKYLLLPLKTDTQRHHGVCRGGADHLHAHRWAANI